MEGLAYLNYYRLIGSSDNFYKESSIQTKLKELCCQDIEWCRNAVYDNDIHLTNEEKIFLTKVKCGKPFKIKDVEKYITIIQKIKSYFVSDYSRMKIVDKDSGWICDNNIHKHFMDWIQNNNKSGYIEIDVDDIQKVQNGSTEVVYASYVTDQMLEYDDMVLNRMEVNNNMDINMLYRPYYFEIAIDYYKIKDVVGEIREKIWLKCNITNHKKSKNDREDEPDGYLIWGASPLHKEGIEITVERINEQDIINKIDKTYNVHNMHMASVYEVKKTFNNIFDGYFFKEARIYKVGDANCIYIKARKGKEERRLLYDIGIGHKRGTSSALSAKLIKYTDAIKAITHFKPDAVFISHWDTDHYIAYVYAQNDIFDCKWLAPDPQNAKTNAIRLVKYLYNKNNILLLDSLQEADFNITNELCVLKANKSDPCTTPINYRGIALCIKSKTKKSLFMGDVPYKSLPVVANFNGNNPYDNLIVPHHAANMDLSLLTAKIKKGNAYICTEGTNAKHPDSKHVDKLKLCYSNVVYTENFKKGFEKIKI